MASATTVPEPIVNKSLEQLKWYSGNAEDRHVRDLLAGALKNSDASSLKKPNLVSVAFREEQGKPVVFHWIGSPPGADGVILTTRSGTKWSGTSAFPINKVFLERNQENQKGPDAHAICHAAILLESTGVIKIPRSEFVSGQLTLKGQPVSNVCIFRDVVISPEEAKILKLVHKHVKFIENEDLDGFLKTIHPETKDYENTIAALKDMYEKVDISIEIPTCRVVDLQGDTAEVSFVQAVRRVKGLPMQDYQIDGTYILKKHEGEWRFFSTIGGNKSNL